jgi:TonB family protein
MASNPVKNNIASIIILIWGNRVLLFGFLVLNVKYKLIYNFTTSYTNLSMNNSPINFYNRQCIISLNKMKISLIIILISTCNIIKAQNTFANPANYRIIRKDTINIRGVIYDSFNQLVKRQLIYTRLNGLYPVSDITDDNGNFKLNGASPKDTLIIDLGGGDFIIPNNGSRYLEIHLPPMHTIESNVAYGNITAARKFKKNPPTVFKIETDILDEYGSTSFATFKNGGEAGFFKFVQANIKYPQKAIDNNIEGEVKVTFDIEKDGTLSNIILNRGIGYGCDEQVVNAVKKSPNWIPARSFSRVSVSPSSVTINFKLTDK